MGFQLIGTVTIDPRTIAVGSTAHALRWMLFMPALSQCAKVFDRVPGNKRALFWVLLLGLGGALVVNYFDGALSGLYTRGVQFYGVSVYPVRAPALRCDCHEDQISRTGFMGAGGAVRLWGSHFCDSHCSSVSPALVAHPSRGFYYYYDEYSSRDYVAHPRLAVQSHCDPGGRVSLYEKYRPLFFWDYCRQGDRVLVSFVVDLIWFPGGGHGVHGWA